MSEPLYMMVKPAGQRCNLRCDYCYYLLSGQARTTKATQMSDELLEQYIRQYIAIQPEGVPVEFCWHGGEPLLRDRSFYEKAIALQQHYAQGRPILNIIQTNGTLMTDDWCRFFREQGWLVGISIDGPEPLHDRYRSVLGHGTFAQVMQAIERMQRHGVEYNLMTVIHRDNARQPLETYWFLRSLGTPYLQFSPNVEWQPGTDQLLPSAVDPLDFGQFYCTIFDEWFAHDVGRVFVQLFDATLALLMDQAPGVCLYGEQCGHATMLEADGSVYCCDHFATDAYRLGNLMTNPLSQMLHSDTMQQFRSLKPTLQKACGDCEYRSLCHGECPKNRRYLCAGYRQYFAHTLPIFEHMKIHIRL